METIFGIPADALMIALIVILTLIGVGVLIIAIRNPVPFKLGLRNLKRRRSQTILIIAGLALSTLIITSALGIGDTVAFSVTSGVYEELGGIDERIGAGGQESAASLGFGSAGPTAAALQNNWFDESIAEDVRVAFDKTLIDGIAPAAIETLPVFNNTNGLSEAAVEIRGIGQVAGDGFIIPEGISDLESNETIINQSLSEVLDLQEGDTLTVVNGQGDNFRVLGIVPDGELAGGSAAILLPLARVQDVFARPDQLTEIFISNAGDMEAGPDLTKDVIAHLTPYVGGQQIQPVKLDRLETAASSAEFITTLFVTFGTFSIFSGILLIFLIFSVLAAERKPELGMGRAVGLQRSDLVRQFVTEGLGYNFIAALVGATLGVLAAIFLATTIAELLGGGELNITPRVSPRSAFIGYSLGLVVTFVTVTISAFQISKLNIIAAIRDLDLPSLPRESQWTLFLRPFAVWRAAIEKAGKGNRREAFRLFLLAGPRAIIAFWAGLLARGPVLMAIGYLFAWVGVNVAEQSGVYGLGVSLFIIGFGQMAAWLLISERLAYSLVGLGLILYWSLPILEVGGLAELGSNPGDFFISGMFLVGGAILLFLYNADRLLNVFANTLGKLGRLLPVARVSIAYPTLSKGRTAVTLAMFSLVVFTLVGTTTITNTFSNFLNADTGSGGYDVVAQANPFNPVSSERFETTIASLVDEGSISEPEVIASSIFAPVEAQGPGMDKPASYVINGVDDAFIESQELELAGIALGYADEAAVWSAMQNDPSLIVIDSFSVDRTGDPTFQTDPDSFMVQSLSANDSVFSPVTIEIIGVDGQAREYTIVGVLSTAPSFYGAMMNSEAARELGYVSPNKYYVRLSEGADSRQAANAIEGAFAESGVQSTLIKEQLEQSRQATRSVFYLIQGFIALGLLIGIAALGVVTIRAVVERRQQIGVLRAIGFQPRMVEGVFLMEGVFIAGLGTLIGYVLALTFSYNLYLQVASDQGLAFLPPWPALIGIGLSILVASLLTTWLPARSAAKVTIAETLRYE